MVNEKITNDELKSIDWKQVCKDMFEAKIEFGRETTNKEQLSFLILKATGILFNDIKITRNDGTYKLQIDTEYTRPELGVTGRYIRDMSFGLYYRDLQKIGNHICLSFCPALVYRLLSLASIGFSLDTWFYYNIERKEWFTK